MPAPRKYPDELRERAVRLVFDMRAETGSKRGPIGAGSTEQVGD